MRIRTIAWLVAATGLSLALIGAGLGATWSDTGSATQVVNVGSFGIELWSDSPGAVVSENKHSITITTPTLLSSAAGQAPIQFTVTLVGSIPALITVSQSSPSAPFFGLPVLPAAGVVLNQGESQLYDAGIGWPELDTSQLGATGSITYTVDAGDVPTVTHVTPVAPTASDESADGTVQGGITIPAVTGVDYSIGGSPAAAGFHARPPGTYTVTAVAQSGFVLDGYPAGGWDLEVQKVPAVHVTADAPTKQDAACGGTPPGGITIPDVVGVKYFIEGTLADAGFHALAVGTYQVTAEARAGYVLDGQDTWNRTVDQDPCPVTAEAPTKRNESCTATGDGGITIPDVVGVKYFIEGTLADAGFHALAVGTYQVTAEAKANYVLVGDSSWSRTVGKDVCVEFVGRTVGTQATASIALPAGWQPGDLAVVVIMRNATATIPFVPTGYTGWATASGGSGTSQVVSRLAHRTLQAGDTAISTGTGYRAALVMVYRNAQPGVATGNAHSTSTTLTFPTLGLQQPNGTSWVGAIATNFGGLRNAAAPTGMVSRTFDGGGSATGPGGFDTNGGVSAFASRTITASAPWNAYSFELKVNP